MKIKTQDLTGAALDWAVAVAEGEVRYGVADFREQRRRTVKHGEYVFRYSQSWSQMGPIIEREGIGLSCHQMRGGAYWRAFSGGETDNYMTRSGDTPLIAAARCYVASKLGDDVDVPEELL